MKKVSFWVSAAALLVPLGALADAHEEEAQPALSDVWFVIPKAGMEAEFMEAAAAEMAKRAEMGESRRWDAYGVAVGHNIRPIQYRSCCFEWADVDALVAEGEEKGLDDSWNENVGPYVDHYHHYMEAFDWENSHWPDTGTDGPYFGVTSWKIKSGSGAAMESIRKQLSEMALENGWASDDNNWLWHSRIGGKPIQMIVSSYASYADMAPPEQSFFEFVAEQMGSEEEAAELFAAWGASFTGSDYTVWEHIPELSSAPDEEE